MAATIYLHWSATPYSWVRQGLYHTIVAGDGHLYRLHSYTIDLNAHTWRRNSNAVAISCACMGGSPDPWAIPPTEAQIEAMCTEVADLALSWDWRADDITIQRVMTHAEAASNRDGRIMHDNYGPVAWGGTGERWDFMQLRKGGPAEGGEELRRRIRARMRGEIKPGADQPSLVFRRSASMGARGTNLAVEIDEHGTSWALVADLLSLYDIPYEWNASQRRVLIGSTDIAPTYQDDAVQASIGHPLFEMSLQGGNSPVILRGIMRADRGWCRVLEFAEEFGITASFQPFALGERRGG
ncbi:N-acetylmuramoyl-L-alanine amidase [Synechococcus sp. EJ6-Ellesmere]|uniref:peptidoglycan recognition protein family protein n=1 Tax=Synechococcus sp. EJ6-Ellesmere TaxID=2823734 RepID=UPI0020CCFBC9|nr:N-acetylmuramoyl-L-alanine amidase [Synechococcus sp. EJ6-Ellesmere]MCP9826604.1 N-acetylmuramoyl-L-alanine amidase [Synechococcus sp. EJ6-Ellesmere]